MKLVSWNINSLRLRLPLLKKFIAKANPDVVCLQEIKVSDPEFPLLEVKALGFDFVEFSGEKSYNGVAILSKFPLTKINKIDVCNYGHKRHISATVKGIELHNFYVPAGGDIPDVALNDKFAHKLKFIDWMTTHFSSIQDLLEEEAGSPYLGGSSRRVSATKGVHKKIILVGDLNIAPLEHDVWSHKQLLKIVSHTPIEVEKMTRLQESLNFIDTHRHFVDASEKLYSWWSYRAKDPLTANKGRRLDHIWATPNLKSNIKSMKIYRDFRSEIQPSDHVPIETVFDFL
ncbi:MAG: endonuclease/exonuclease/phosphatase family protein [Proteobacteria bacterium]|nr:endonuclease/exonuclease/phosphatase family protein [Pseudomonadota bacterium]